jgi:hypothetical protein
MLMSLLFIHCVFCAQFLKVALHFQKQHAAAARVLHLYRFKLLSRLLKVRENVSMSPDD